MLQIHKRTECQPKDSTRVGKRPRSFRDIDNSVDGYHVAAGRRCCRLLAPWSRRAAGAAILSCDAKPLVGLQAPLRMSRNPCTIGWAGWKLSASKLQMHQDSHLVAPRKCCLPPPTRCAKAWQANQRPGRGRLSVGCQSTAGKPAGRNSLKLRKARRLLHCPGEAAPPSCPT